MSLCTTTPNLWTDLSPIGGDSHPTSTCPHTTGDSTGTEPQKPALTSTNTCPRRTGDSAGTGTSATCPRCPPPYGGTAVGQPGGQDPT